jgi:hypothetical protein
MGELLKSVYVAVSVLYTDQSDNKFAERLRSIADSYTIPAIANRKPIQYDLNRFCRNNAELLPTLPSVVAVDPDMPEARMHLFRCAYVFDQGRDGVIYTGALAPPGSRTTTELVVVKFSMSRKQFPATEILSEEEIQKEQETLRSTMQTETEMTRKFRGLSLFMQYRATVVASDSKTVIYNNDGIMTQRVQSHSGLVSDYIEGPTLFDFVVHELHQQRSITTAWIACITVQRVLAQLYTVGLGLKNDDMHMGNIMLSTNTKFEFDFEGEKLACPAIRVIDMGRVQRVTYIQEGIGKSIWSEFEGVMSLQYDEEFLLDQNVHPSVMALFFQIVDVDISIAYRILSNGAETTLTGPLSHLFDNLKRRFVNMENFETWRRNDKVRLTEIDLLNQKAVKFDQTRKNRSPSSVIDMIERLLRKTEFFIEVFDAPDLIQETVAYIQRMKNPELPPFKKGGPTRKNAFIIGVVSCLAFVAMVLTLLYAD